MIPPLISLEEHFFSAAMFASPTAAKYSEQFKHLNGLRDKLADVGPIRLAGMDANHISSRSSRTPQGPCRRVNADPPTTSSRT